LAALLFSVPASSAPAATAYQDIGLPAGPLTKVAIGADLSCQTAHTGDSVFEFFPSGATPGDCGTFVFVDGVLFTPDFASHGNTATTALGTRTPFTEVSQPPPTGSGTTDDPRQVTTTVGLGATGIQITQTDSYVAGQESYGTQITFDNTGGNPKDIVLYRAGDCYLQGSDKGYGFSTANNAVGCSANANNSPAGRVEVWTPQSPGATFTENTYSNVWNQISQHVPFPNDCGQCTSFVDNAAGLSWALTVPPGTATAVRSSAAGFSPTGELPPGSQPPTGNPPPGGSGPPTGTGPPNYWQRPSTRPECLNATTLLVTCADPNGGPGVCGPSGTILPQCYFPVTLPTVCGPSGTILQACAPRTNYVAACGGTGTILPVCNLPRPNIPQVCGGTGTILPPCTGANNPIVVCGGTGTILGQCSIPPTARQGTLNTATGVGEVDVTVGCPNANRPLAVKARPPTTCQIDAVVADFRRTKVSALKAEFARWAPSMLAANLKDEYSPIQAQQILRHDTATYMSRSNLVIDREFSLADAGARVAGLDSDVSTLNAPGLLPAYFGLYKAPIADKRQIWIGHLGTAIKDYVVFLDYRRNRRPLAVSSATSTSGLVAPLARRHVRVRAGQRVRVRVRLSRAAVRQLTRGLKKPKAVAIRLMVTYRTRGLPVLWMTDFSVRIVKTRPRGR
jgi:hypothetical protein